MLLSPLPGGESNITLVHWCWIPTQWKEMMYQPGQAQGLDYILTRCEGPPLPTPERAEPNVRINVLWQ